MIKLNILKKVQLVTLIAIISSTFILVYVDSVYAIQSLNLSEDMEKCMNGELSEYVIN